MSEERFIDSNPGSYDRVVAPMEIAWFRRWRGRMLARLDGHVLDIGSGTGANFPFYPDGVRCVTVLDPSHENIRYLKRKAGGHGWGPKSGRCLRSRVGVGEEMPFRSGSFDHVVSTLILCTVRDPESVVSEGIRVLKKGGTYVFIEHQLPRWLPQSLIFQAVTPIWRAPSGCNLNRRTEELVKSRKELKEQFSERRGPVLGFPFFLGIFRKV